MGTLGEIDIKNQNLYKTENQFTALKINGKKNQTLESDTKI